MMQRLGWLCCLLLWILAAGFGSKDTIPTFTWSGRWEKTELRGSYGSFIKLQDGRIARFGDIGLPKSICPGMMFCGGIGITVTRDLTCEQFPGPDGKPTGLKDMRIYYDDERDEIHGMLSVWDKRAQDWRKYHNIAKVSRR